MLTLSLLLAASISLHLVLYRRVSRRVFELEIWREVRDERLKRLRATGWAPADGGEV